MKRILFIILASYLVSSTAHAQAGETGLAFLKLGVGARSLGMGEAYSAVASDPSAMYYNPAGLSFGAGAQLLLMHKEWIQGVKTEYIAGMTSTGDLTFGLSVNATSVDDIELRSVPGPPLGTFDARNAAIGLTASWLVTPSLSVGATGKYLYEKILIDEASGAGFDIGAAYQTPLKIRLAAAFSNLGSMGVLHDQSSTLPKMFRAGGSYQSDLPGLDGDLVVASDIVSVTGSDLVHACFGAEFLFRKTFAVRIGYETGYDTRNISGGTGVRYGAFALDYAFVPFEEELGTTHTFSLLIDFR